MCAVFVSHSKYDVEMINFFTNITSKEGIKNYFMEWEDLNKKYPAIRISDIIKSDWIEDINMVVVLLGPNLANPPNMHYTQNWVTFEVGVAAGCNKPVLVLEEINHITDFPIPYVTDYCQYQLGNNEDRKNIGKIMNNIHEIRTNSVKVADDVPVTCGYDDCNAKFNLWMRHSNNINCPVCRRPIIIS